MFQNVLDDIIKFYKKNYEAIEKQEIYKWEAIKHFQSHWEDNPEDFHSMLAKSLEKTSNLLSSGQYFPRRVILRLSEREPEAVKGMFNNLFNEELNLTSRIDDFHNSAENLVAMCYPEESFKSYQDHRAAMAYITLRYPDSHFLYKFQMYKHFVELIDYNEKPKVGDVNNVLFFEDLCKFIISKVEDDHELLDLYKSRQKMFSDKNFHLLAQDIIYTGQYYSGKSVLEEDNYQRVSPEDIKLEDIEFKPLKRNALHKKPSLKASKVNFESKHKANKRVGDFGELFVLEYEKAKLKSYGLKNKNVQRVSTIYGDGLGYDILSYDKDGKELYIEVKTTCGKIDSEFYVSANELHRSIIDSEKFLLYRVYEFDKKSLKGKIAFKYGSLQELCISPQSYTIKLSTKDLD